MLSYKSELSEKRTKILKSIYNFFENGKVFIADESENIEFTESKEGDLNESFEFLFDDKVDVKIKNRSLKRIANIISQSNGNILSILTPENLKIIIEHAFQQETCSSAFYALCIITYYSGNFNDIIIDSDLFIFISESLQKFDEYQFYDCVILLINLFITIPLQKPLDVNLIYNLINFDISKVVQTPDIVSLYSIIMDKDDFPKQYIYPIYKTFKNILFQSIQTKSDESIIEKIKKTKKKVFKKINLLLDDQKYQKNTISFINNNDIIMPIMKEMDESNVKCCLSIILKMMKKDDTFVPQLQAYGFENKLIELCQKESKNIQHFAIFCSVEYIKIFPKFAFKFSDFEFERNFIDATFENKVAFVELYYMIFSVNIENEIVFTLNFSKQFLSEILFMIDSGDDFVKADAYNLLVLFLECKSHFVFDPDYFNEITSEEVVNIAENDSLSKCSDLSDNASCFLKIIKEIINQNKSENI